MSVQPHMQYLQKNLKVCHSLLFAFAVLDKNPSVATPLLRALREKEKQVDQNPWVGNVTNHDVVRQKLRTLLDPYKDELYQLNAVEALLSYFKNPNMERLTKLDQFVTLLAEDSFLCLFIVPALRVAVQVPDDSNSISIVNAWIAQEQRGLADVAAIKQKMMSRL